MRVSKGWLNNHARQEALHVPEPQREANWPIKRLCGWCERYDSYSENGGDFVNAPWEERIFMCGRCLEEV